MVRTARPFRYDADILHSYIVDFEDYTDARIEGLDGFWLGHNRYKVWELEETCRPTCRSEFSSQQHEEVQQENFGDTRACAQQLCDGIDGRRRR